MGEERKLSGEQEMFLSRLGKGGDGDGPAGEHPGVEKLGEWLRDKEFRRRYLGAREALVQEVIRVGMELWLQKGEWVLEQSGVRRKRGRPRSSPKRWTEEGVDVR